MPETVSVITTTYNAGQHVEAAVRSILRQTYDHLEYLVVDDGSTDDTQERIRSFSDSRLRLIDAGRVGRGRALNIGWLGAQGRLIAIQDADDVADPDRLAIQTRVLGVRADVAVLGTDHRSIGEETFPVQPWDRSLLQPKDVSRLVTHYNPISHTSLMLRREALSAVGGYDEERSAVFDWDLYVRLLAAGYRIHKYPIPLVCKRFHDRQHFEAGRRFPYVCACAQVQIRALRQLKSGALAFSSVPAWFAYRLLPRPLRLAMRRLLSASLD